MSARLRYLFAQVRDREQVRGLLWLIPTLFVAAAVVLAEVMLTVDERSTAGASRLLFRGTVDGSEQVLATLATAMLTFIGVVFSISVVAVYLASTQFSPRVLRQFTRDRVNQVVLGVFAATFTYTIVVLGSIRLDPIDPEAVSTRYSVTVALLLTLASLLAFLVYVHHITHSMRAAKIIELIASETRASIRKNYLTGRVDLHQADAHWAEESPFTRIPMKDSGVVTELSAQKLADLALDRGVGLRLVPRLGAYVSAGAPLFEVYAAGDDREPRSLGVDDVWPLVQVEIERTVRDDPAFGFRQLVDMAERALSPALNDPTTAVAVIDRLEDLLYLLRDLPLREGAVPPEGRDEPRLLYTGTSWDEYVSLSFDELRSYGSESLPVMRRLHAAISHLLDALPAHRPERRAALEWQHERLDDALDQNFPGHYEHVLAGTADVLGVGGAEIEDGDG